MAISRTATERQIQLAKNDLALRVKALKAAGKSETEFGSDPTWRAAQAKVKQLVNRLKRVAETEALNADVARAKAEREAAAAEPKAPKPKKEKPAEKKPAAESSKKDAAPRKEKSGGKK